MIYDINSFIYAFDENDTEKLGSLEYSYHCNLTYVNESDYELLELLFNIIIDRIYDMSDREVQETYFMLLGEGIALNAGKYENLYKCVDRLIGKIGKVPMSSWELAETLLVVSGLIDKRYYGLMEKYKNHEDAYVREVVEEYFYDIKMEEEERKVSQEKGSDSLELYFNVIVDRIFDTKDPGIKGKYFRSLSYTITTYIGKYEILYKCIDRLINKIEKETLNSWELAETLLVVSNTMDRRYYNLMKKYKDHEDAYVRKVVRDYLYNVMMEEKEHKISQEKGSDLGSH